MVWRVDSGSSLGQNAILEIGPLKINTPTALPMTACATVGSVPEVSDATEPPLRDTLNELTAKDVASLPFVLREVEATVPKFA